MKYSKSQMQQLVNNDKNLQKRLKEIMKSMELEKNFALKALYHTDVADGGKYQQAYQELDQTKQ
ncbi:hypothetical protein [Rummeliibacillus pycnus]|uniref:hypothetical protein n=1 Tax=Rummeliibacillus pycnus TaxID=101070 RepID=UPI003D271CE6